MPHCCRLQLGSWSLAVRSTGPLDASILAFLYKGNVSKLGPDDWWTCTQRLCLGTSPSGSELSGPDAQGHWNLDLSKRERGCTHLLMNRLNQSLQSLVLKSEVLVLHASAVAFEDGQCWLFLGPRGSGKSTLALALTRQGGVILADDRVALRNAERPSVSGCNRTAKLTAKTERHFFKQGLSERAKNYQGLSKKIWTIPDDLSCPQQDHTPTRVFFPRVGEKFSLQAMPGSVALLRLLDQSRESLGYAGSPELPRLVGMLTELLRMAPAYELNLSPNLDFLRTIRLRLEGQRPNR